MRDRYQSSEEEIKRAEESMTDQQRLMSQARAEGYGVSYEENVKKVIGGDTVFTPKIEKYPGGSYKVLDPEVPWMAKAHSNGIEINVHWVNMTSTQSYEIFFPQIESPSDEARKNGVSDQVITISRRPEIAKQVYEYAVKQAKTEPNVYKLYKKVEEYSKDLPRDIEGMD